MFNHTHDRLTQAGFRHYEISNFALPGYESRHNQAYWKGKDFRGIGPSAVSTIRGIRQRNGKLQGGTWKIEEKEVLPPSTLAAERMVLGLRTDEGIDEKAFAQEFGFRPQEKWAVEIQQLEQNDLLVTQPALRLTHRGRLVADEIAVQFL